jgi:hypothetical protein
MGRYVTGPSLRGGGLVRFPFRFRSSLLLDRSSPLAAAIVLAHDRATIAPPSHMPSPPRSTAPQNSPNILSRFSQDFADKLHYLGPSLLDALELIG